MNRENYSELLDPVMKYRVLCRLAQIMHDMRNHSPTANHFYRLSNRLEADKKLTKKMQENLAWVIRDIKKELELYSK